MVNFKIRRYDYGVTQPFWFVELEANGTTIDLGTLDITELDNLAQSLKDALCDLGYSVIDNPDEC